MKLFIAACFLALALSTVTADKDKYEMMLKKWGKMKAMEGCFGAENFKDWMMTMKKAKSKCSGKPAPELNLPMFQKKVRVVNTLLKNGAEDKQDDFVDNLMRKAYIRKMMRKRMVDLMGEDDDEMFLGAKLRSRYTRAVEDEDAMEGNDLDLADKMVSKLKHMEAMFNSDIGNMTCVLQEVGAINEAMEIDVASIDKMVDDGKWTAEETGDGVDRTWLAQRAKTIHGICKDLSDAVPESILNDCSLPHYVTRIIYFKKCKKFHKMEACMHSDVRNMISQHGMSVKDLAKEAGLEEKDIAALVSVIKFA